MKTVHSLVLTGFRGKRPKGKECRHLDGDRRNSRIENLVWGTPLENRKDAEKHGTATMPPHLCGEENGSARLSEANVRYIASLILSGIRCYEIAEMFGIGHNTVICIKQGKTWSHLFSEEERQKLRAKRNWREKSNANDRAFASTDFINFCSQS